MAREELRIVLDRMVMTWGVATTWRVHWQAMLAMFDCGRGTPVWQHEVGRA